MILKILPAFLALAAGITIGGFGGSKIATKAAEAAAVPCNCNCPPAAVLKLAPELDLDKLNNKKGHFEYKPTTEISNVTVVIDCQDSVMLKKLLEKGK